MKYLSLVAVGLLIAGCVEADVPISLSLKWLVKVNTPSIELLIQNIE